MHGHKTEQAFVQEAARKEWKYQKNRKHKHKDEINVSSPFYKWM